MPVTQSTDLFSAQVLIDSVRGRFKRKTAFLGSALVSGGAVRVLPTMPHGGKGALNKTVDIPYYGVLGGFSSNPEGSSASPQKVAQTSEQATIGRSSLMVETSILAQGVAMGSPELGNPYDEAAAQAMVEAEREMDRQIVAKVKTTPLVLSLYNASSPVYLEHRHVIQARSKWGDEQDDIVGMVTHSQALADLATIYDAMGRPLLIETVQEGQEGVVKRSFGGVPLTVSDSVPLDGSTMGSVTSTGSTPPVATLVVADATKMGPWDLRIEVLVGGAHTTATFRFSVDGGQTWSATLTTAGVGVALPLVDTAVDSLVGNNGQTGLTVAFAAGTFNSDNRYSSIANLSCSTLLLQRDAAIFWYNADRLGAKTDIDIAEDTDLFAMHLYYIAHMYRRRRMGSRPGVVKITHNLRGFTG